MNCNDIDQALDKGAITIAQEREIEEHLIGCSRCRKLVEALSQPEREASVSSTPLFEQIERRLLSDLHPVRRTKKEYLLIALGTIFVVGVAFGVYRVGAFALAVMTHLQAGVMLSAVAMAAVLASYSLVNLILPGNLQRITPSILPWGVALFEETSHLPALVLGAETTFPTQRRALDADTNESGVEVQPFVAVLKQVRGLAIQGNIGLGIRHSASHREYQSAYNGAVALPLRHTSFALIGEVNASFSPLSNTLTFSPGIHYSLGKNRYAAFALPVNRYKGSVRVDAVIQFQMGICGEREK